MVFRKDHSYRARIICKCVVPPGSSYQDDLHGERSDIRRRDYAVTLVEDRNNLSGGLSRVRATGHRASLAARDALQTDARRRARLRVIDLLAMVKYTCELGVTCASHATDYLRILESIRHTGLGENFLTATFRRNCRYLS